MSVQIEESAVKHDAKHRPHDPNFGWEGQGKDKRTVPMGGDPERLVIARENAAERAKSHPRHSWPRILTTLDFPGNATEPIECRTPNQVALAQTTRADQWSRAIAHRVPAIQMRPMLSYDPAMDILRIRVDFAALIPGTTGNSRREGQWLWHGRKHEEIHRASQVLGLLDDSRWAQVEQHPKVSRLIARLGQIAETELQTAVWLSVPAAKKHQHDRRNRKSHPPAVRVLQDRERADRLDGIMSKRVAFAERYAPAILRRVGKSDEAEEALQIAQNLMAGGKDCTANMYQSLRQMLVRWGEIKASATWSWRSGLVWGAAAAGLAAWWLLR